MSANQVIHPPGPCTNLRDKDHGFVGSNGHGRYCTQTCLDIAEGRKPQKYGRDEN